MPFLYQCTCNSYKSTHTVWITQAALYLPRIEWVDCCQVQYMYTYVLLTLRKTTKCTFLCRKNWLMYCINWRHARQISAPNLFSICIVLLYKYSKSIFTPACINLSTSESERSKTSESTVWNVMFFTPLAAWMIACHINLGFTYTVIDVILD